jgi:hypothetical protein
MSSIYIQGVEQKIEIAVTWPGDYKEDFNPRATVRTMKVGDRVRISVQ